MPAETHAEKAIISIGCDCHPAYVLQKSGLRRESMPFDWLDTEPTMGIKYVHDNITTSFRYFLSGLRKNEQNHIYSLYYRHATFMHHTDLMEKEESFRSFVRRSERFLNHFNNKSCVFLYNIGSDRLYDIEGVNYFVESVVAFKRILKEGDELCIYIRYDESVTENQGLCMALFHSVRAIQGVKIVHYVREKDKFGIWGDADKYVSLLDQFGIPVLTDQKNDPGASRVGIMDGL